MPGPRRRRAVAKAGRTRWEARAKGEGVYAWRLGAGLSQLERRCGKKSAAEAFRGVVRKWKVYTSSPYTLHPTLCILHPALYTLHPTLCTLHPTPYTLHPTPYTLHPTPYSPHPTSRAWRAPERKKALRCRAQFNIEYGAQAGPDQEACARPPKARTIVCRVQGAGCRV